MTPEEIQAARAKEIRSTVLDASGAALVVAGVALLSIPVAFIVAGLAVLLIAHPITVRRRDR